jgi:hypothetical protein
LSEFAEYDSRAGALKQQVADAQAALGEIDPGDREPHVEHVKRLEIILAYVALVIEGTDVELISDAAINELGAPLASILANPAAVPASASAWGSQLLDAAARLPASRDREPEERLRAVVAAVEKDARDRVKGLTEQFNDVQAAIEAVRTDLDTRKQEVTTETGALATSFQQRLDELEATAASFRESIDQIGSQQTQAFTEAQTKRESDFQERLEGSEKRLEEFLETSKSTLDTNVSEIQRMAEETGQLAGAIALGATAERYGEERDEQKGIADRLRLASMVMALLAVVLAFLVTLQSHPDNATFAGKLSVSLLIGAIATYLAKQSGRHRRREEKARTLQLELTAFSPFIEPLPADKQIDERILMTRKTFGRVAADAEEEDGGPMPLGHALERLSPRKRRPTQN